MADPWGYGALEKTFSNTANNVSSHLLRLGQIAQRQKAGELQGAYKLFGDGNSLVRSPNAYLREMGRDMIAEGMSVLNKHGATNFPKEKIEAFKAVTADQLSGMKQISAGIADAIKRHEKGEISQQDLNDVITRSAGDVEQSWQADFLKNQAKDAISRSSERAGVNAVADYTAPTMPQAAPVNANPGLTDIAQPQQGWQDSENVPAIQPEGAPQAAPAEGGEIGLAPQVPTVQAVTPPPAMTMDIPQTQTPQYPSREQLTAMGGSPSTRPFFEKIAERALDQKMPKAETPTEIQKNVNFFIGKGKNLDEAIKLTTGRDSEYKPQGEIGKAILDRDHLAERFGADSPYVKIADEALTAKTKDKTDTIVESVTIGGKMHRFMFEKFTGKPIKDLGLSEKAEKPTVTDIKTGYDMAMNNLKTKALTEMTPEERVNFGNVDGAGLMAAMMSGQLGKALTPARKAGIIKEAQDISNYYLPMIDDVLGRKGVKSTGLKPSAVPQASGASSYINRALKGK